MIIHTVKPGDTVFKIARRHGTSPMKIVEDNGLTNPDSLTVGEELLIINPTRTCSARGSDTLDVICERFSVDRDSLLRKNPYLSGTDKIYPGQILSIKHDAPPFAIAAANGYYYKGCSAERLAFALPYLTYLTVAAAKRRGRKVELLFDEADIVNEARERRVLPLLRIYDEGTDFSDGYIDELIALAKERNYSGILLAPYREMQENPHELEEFLMKLKKRTLLESLLLFLEIDANESLQIKDVCDGYTLMYDKCQLDEIPSFEAGEEATVKRLCESLEPSKLYIDLPTLAYAKSSELGLEALLRHEAISTVQNAGGEIITDDERGVCHFEYNRYKAGRKTPTRVTFESLKNIKAKLGLVDELGLMGVAFDIMRVPVPYLMMLEVSFSKPTLF